MLVESQGAQSLLCINGQDFRRSVAGIKRQHDRDQAAHDMSIRIAEEDQFGIVAVAARRMQPDLADAAGNLVHIIARMLGVGCESAAEFNDVAVALLPIIEEGEVVLDALNVGLHIDRR